MWDGILTLRGRVVVMNGHIAELGESRTAGVRLGS